MSTQNEADEQLCKLDNIITFNGQGCSGKTTQVKILAKSDKKKYECIHSYELRRKFKEKVYEKTEGMDTSIKYLNENGTCKKLYHVEVLGIPSIAWLTAYFHLRVKPLLLGGSIVVLDHYIGDYYADMLASVDIEDFRSLVREDLAIPDFDQGTHFYLVIDDHEMYKCRWRKREEKKHPKNPEKRRKPPVTPSVFEERRERYEKLCELKLLKRINATVCEDEVAKTVQKFLAQLS